MSRTFLSNIVLTIDHTGSDCKALPVTDAKKVQVSSFAHWATCLSSFGEQHFINKKGNVLIKNFIYKLEENNIEKRYKKCFVLNFNKMSNSEWKARGKKVSNWTYNMHLLSHAQSPTGLNVMHVFTSRESTYFKILYKKCKISETEQL